ncbi:endonuclease [Hahella sp. KA22]|uniref:endonuclease/exonuclease/phosphatase family protein n=1 Tax=Hahella sp. KA22 TaxID=1628392 RepID=UPI000FDF3955|nr:endonuclease/exonuclease/phosphatase family protein [Hahella sp. KA22]AZZ93261.1 endonuclease [Hahella sp. KA22]QAY56635.1 endonuclease [Hahella sp. KA22]
MRVATWNSQGNPTSSDSKIKILSNLLNECDIILIQECGGLSQASLDSVSTQKWLYSCEQVGAFNNRCTTCIISKQVPVAHGCIYLQTDTGRSSLYATFGEGFTVLTFHANAGGRGAADAQLVGQHAVGKIPGNFIIGGDFNCVPFDLSSRRNIIRIGSNSRGKELRIVSSGSNTHPGSHHELDYFLVSENIDVRNVAKYHMQGGDHYPVIMEFDIGY